MMEDQEEFDRYMTEYKHTNRNMMLGLINDYALIAILSYLSVLVTIIVVSHS